MAKAKGVFKRAEVADTRHGKALSLFQQAAQELESVAAEHRDVADEAAEIRDEYHDRHTASVASAAAAEEAAKRLRELVG